jgi:hypothetical protein
VPFWNVRDLESKLISFKDFYNDQRCHYALGGDTPNERTGKTRSEVADLHSYRWRSHCRGLYHLEPPREFRRLLCLSQAAMADSSSC